MLLKTLEVRSIENPRVPISRALEFLGGEPTAAGQRVTEEGAMKAVAVLAAVRVLAETVAHLPLNLYRRLQPKGKDVERQHRLFGILHDQPNPKMTAFTFRETQMVSLLLHANAYAEKQRNGKRDVVALWPLLPDRTRLVRNGSREYYEVKADGGRERRLDPADVFHLRTLSLDGFNGWFCVRLFREAIGVLLAMEEFGARWFGQGSRPAGAIMHPGVLDEKAHDQLRSSWERLHSGVGNAHRVAILEEGSKFEAIAVPPEESQFLQSQQFGVTQIARAFRIPPHMLGDLTRATFTNIEMQNLEFHQETMLPWLKRWEQEINRQLLTEEERPQLFAEFVPDAILRGDTVSRFKAYFTGRQGGWLSTNDVREKENMNPVDRGDDYLRPLNLVPVDDEASADTEDSPEPEGGDGQAAPEPERRANGSSALRRRLTLAFQPLLRSTVARVLRIEARDVARAAERFLERGELREFQEWLREYYFEKHPAFITKRLEGAFQSFAESIAATAAEEIGVDPIEADRVENFTASYAAGYAARHSAASRREIERLVDSPPEGKSATEAVREAVEPWDSARAGRVAEDESHKLAGAAARMAFVALGIMAFRWRTFGADCPLCSLMDGKRVGSHAPFLGQGDALNPAGDTAPLIVSTDIRHPPLHKGCDCQLEPDFG